MDKPRTFEEVFKEAYDYWVDDSDPHVHEGGAKGLADQIWQHQQTKVEQLKGQLERAGYTDNGGELMKPPLGKPPRFDLLDELKNSISEMAQKYRAEAHELSRIRDFEKSQMYSHFASELDRLNKGGA